MAQAPEKPATGGKGCRRESNRETDLASPHEVRITKIALEPHQRRRKTRSYLGGAGKKKGSGEDCASRGTLIWKEIQCEELTGEI